MSLQPLPLFPLGTVLVPGAWLPLRIFEVRYLDMVQRCHREGTPFGVVCLVRGAEVDSAGAPVEAFARVGTAAMIEQLDRPQAGLINIRSRGMRRFRVQSAEKGRYGLWTGQVEWLPEDEPVPIPDDLAELASSLRGILLPLGQRHPELFAHDADDPGWGQAGWVANRWCELLPVPPDRRQQLLEVDSPLLRLELVSDELDRLPGLPET